MALIEARVKDFSMDSRHHADDILPSASVSENTKLFATSANKKNIISAEALYKDQNSDSLEVIPPIKKNIIIGGGATECEASQLTGEYPILAHHGLHPNSPAAAGATTQNQIDSSNNIPGFGALQNHAASIVPTAIQFSAAPYSTSPQQQQQQFNSSEVLADAYQFPIPGHSNIPGQFFIPAPGQQTADAATIAQVPTLASSIPDQEPIPPSNSSGASADSAPAKKKRTREARRASCIFCQEIGHRVDFCPFLPCKICANMGHIGKNCPTVTILRGRKSEGKKNCLLCCKKQEPNHRWLECPYRPCRYCTVMGHVGRACPIMIKKRIERKRKAKAWRDA